MIGLKDIHLYAPLESKIGKPDKPIAIRSKLGWTIYGPTCASQAESRIVGHHNYEVSNQKMHDMLRDLYTLNESVISVATLPEFEEDKCAKTILSSATVQIGDRFETELLWKEDEVTRLLPYPLSPPFNDQLQ